MEELIYIIEGEVRVTLPFEIEENDVKVDKFLKRYLLKMAKNVKHEVSTNYSKSDWIGMEEHFDQTTFKSFGVIMSV